MWYFLLHCMILHCWSCTIKWSVIHQIIYSILNNIQWKRSWWSGSVKLCITCPCNEAVNHFKWALSVYSQKNVFNVACIMSNSLWPHLSVWSPLYHYTFASETFLPHLHGWVQQCNSELCLILCIVHYIIWHYEISNHQMNEQTDKRNAYTYFI